MDTAVVTGASRGVGEVVTRAFADAGIHVVCCARSGDELDAVVDDILSDGGEATAVRADVRDEYDVERLMEAAARIGDTIDCVVANAGVYHGTTGETPLAAESYSAFDDHLRTNTRGVFTTVKEAVPHLSESARILVPSGEIAREPKAGLGGYAVSKAGAEAVARQYSAELDAAVGVLDLGMLSTELTDHGPGRDPADVAGMFLWAAKAADAETIDGAVVGLRDWKKATR
ncbi:MAG: SDR family NAD(P)-dependent oxidoreductase [Natronomonas sp.]